ncbi:hypothetical protein [Gudongella oleilytica]|uniref:hypothetical protein n=1 Tax=Gudongella oleilytica TaxID=1582259 RepID=UPI002A370D82|nr:hypothetical protein [Gudongella oleilytica]MDY0257092.1 hypothetical protein [Gudongella oleilytica]
MQLGDIIKGLGYAADSSARLELMEELYWTEYENFSDEKVLHALAEILLRSESIEEHAAVQMLYSNPEGALLDFYQDVIMKLYNKDPLTFIKASTEYPDEGLNVLYIFRNKGFFDDYKTEENRLLDLVDSNDEIGMIRQFFRMYDSLCHT